MELYSDTGTGKESIDECAWYYAVNFQTEPLIISYGECYNINGRIFDLSQLRRPVTKNITLDAEIEKYILETVDAYIMLKLKNNFDEWGVQANLDVVTQLTCVNGEKLHLNLYFNPDGNSYFNTAQIIACPMRTLDGFIVKEARNMQIDGQYRAYFEQ